MGKFLVITLLALSACKPCDLLGTCSSGGGSPAPAPKEREEAVACPEAPECAGKYEGGVVCKPSLEHHSTADKCPLKK